MGWWQSGRHPEDTLGDGPADLLEQELDRLTSDADAKPTFQEVLDGVAAVLDEHAAELLAEPDAYRGQPIVARFEPAATLQSGDAPANSAVQSAIADALKAIAAEYELELSRKPTLSEVLGTIAFVLRVEPEQYLSNPERLALVDILADGGAKPANH